MEKEQFAANWVNLAKDGVKYIVDANIYDVSKDKRLLIPFIKGHKVGFVNQQGEIVVEPVYDAFIGDIFSSEDVVKVMINRPFANVTDKGKVYPYVKYKFGLIDADGKELFETKYDFLAVSDNRELISFCDPEKGFCVINRSGEVIVPFGVYDHIDGFTNGYARVKIGKVSNGMKNNGNKWGIINETGDVVLPVEYDDIWNFYDKPYLKSTVIVKNDESSRFMFSTGITYQQSAPKVNDSKWDEVDLKKNNNKRTRCENRFRVRILPLHHQSKTKTLFYAKQQQQLYSRGNRSQVCNHSKGPDASISRIWSMVFWDGI